MPLRRLLSLLVALGPLILSTLPAPALAEDGLYRALGGREALARVSDGFFARLKADARLAPFFKDTDGAQFARQLTDQLCEVSGGPCRYEGPDMRTAHEDMDIDRRAFNAVVEVLQDAMSAEGIPFATQNRLLARLAPMHRDIVVR